MIKEAVEALLVSSECPVNTPLTKARQTAFPPARWSPEKRRQRTAYVMLERGNATRRIHRPVSQTATRKMKGRLTAGGGHFSYFGDSAFGVTVLFRLIFAEELCRPACCLSSPTSSKVRWAPLSEPALRERIIRHYVLSSQQPSSTRSEILSHIDPDDFSWAVPIIAKPADAGRGLVLSGGRWDYPL